MRIHPVLFAALVLVTFLGTIFGFQLAGVWSVSGKFTSSGEAVQPAGDDVYTIKGWMTLEQIAGAYSVSLAEILAQFDLPPDTPASTAVKDLESEQFSVTNLRDWLQSRMLPVEQTALTATPQVTPRVSPTAIVLPAENVATPRPSEHIPVDKTITGKTTFQELLDWGIPEDVIRAIIGEDLPSPDTVIKDYVTQKGISFVSIKTALQVEADRVK